MKELFGQPYDVSRPDWVVMGFFDVMYDCGQFIEALGLLVKRYGYGNDSAYCSFPDLNSPFEEDHFDGVEFGYGYASSESDDETVIVSETVATAWIYSACEKYLERHPVDAAIVREELEKLQFWATDEA